MAPFTPSVTQSNVLTALGTFLLTILPNFLPEQIIVGQENLVAEPTEGDFIVMTPSLQGRLETNVDGYADCAFQGSIAGAILTVVSINLGTIAPGNQLTGTGVAAGTSIGPQQTGAPGGVGSYAVSPSQTVAQGLMQCGAKSALQPTEMTVQLDVHGPNSADNAQTISNLIWDDFAFQQFNPDVTGIAPLYAEDPKEIPFLNAEQQVERRWVVDVVLQTNPVVMVPQQFADAVQVGLVDVDAAYHP